MKICSASPVITETQVTTPQASTSHPLGRVESGPHQTASGGDAVQSLEPTGPGGSHSCRDFGSFSEGETQNYCAIQQSHLGAYAREN